MLPTQTVYREICIWCTTNAKSTRSHKLVKNKWKILYRFQSSSVHQFHSAQHQTGNVFLLSSVLHLLYSQTYRYICTPEVFLNFDILTSIFCDVCIYIIKVCPCVNSDHRTFFVPNSTNDSYLRLRPWRYQPALSQRINLAKTRPLSIHSKTQCEGWSSPAYYRKIIANHISFMTRISAVCLCFKVGVP